MLTRLGVCCGLMVVMISALHGQDDKAWQEFIAKEEGFRVMMPGKPQRQEKTINGKTGDAKQVTYMFQADAKSGYVAMVHSFTKEAVEGRNVDQMLDSGRDSGIKGVNGVLSSEKKIKLDDGHEGREWRFTAAGGNFFFRWRAYWVSPNMMYHVAVAGTKEFTDSAEAEKFLSSFKLTPKAK